jgi:hypothetical protein
MGEAPRSNPAKQPERRRNRVFVTRNTEYHCRDALCVAVRDRKTGKWIPDHPAISVPVASGLYIDQDSLPHLRTPDLGKPLIFYTKASRKVITTPVQGIGRPEKEVVMAYPPLAATG